MIRRLTNLARARALEWRGRRPYVRQWEGGPLLVLPGVLDPVATRVGAWLARIVPPLARPGERWLDMGCGTGVVGLALVRAGVEVLAVDVDPQAVRNARVNGELRRTPLPAVESDLFAAVPGSWDAVVYNVPFWPGEPGRGRFDRSFYAGENFRAIRRYAQEAPARARRVLVALSEAGADHAGARAAFGPAVEVARERVGGEVLVLLEARGTATARSVS